MLAIKFSGADFFKLEDVEKPDTGPDDALLKISYAPICGTDMGVLSGKIPANLGIIMGHEFSGIIEEVGSNITDFKKGERVIGSPMVSCGTCPYCLQKKFQLCLRRQMFGQYVDGSFAEYMRVPHPERILCATDIEMHTASLIGDTFATGYNAAEKAEIREDVDNVAIFGVGPIGLAAIIGTKLMNPKKLFVIDIIENRLKLAESLGADFVIDAKSVSPGSAIFRETKVGADVVIECAGSSKTLLTGMGVLKRGGRLVMVGLPPETTLPVMSIVYNELTIQGAPLPLGKEALKKVIKIVKEHKLESKLNQFITHYYSLKDCDEAFQMARQGAGIKILFKFV